MRIFTELWSGEMNILHFYYTFVEVGFFFGLYHLENKRIVYFCQYTDEWYIKEIKLLMRNFVSSAAEKWIDLDNAARCNLGF